MLVIGVRKTFSRFFSINKSEKNKDKSEKEKNGKILWEEIKMMRNLIFKFNSIIY